LGESDKWYQGHYLSKDDAKSVAHIYIKGDPAVLYSSAATAFGTGAGKAEDSALVLGVRKPLSLDIAWMGWPWDFAEAKLAPVATGLPGIT